MYWKIAIGVIVFLYVIAKRNAFEKLRREVKHQAANIGIYIDKRSACLNDALNIAKVSYRQEVEGIEKLTAKDQLNQLAYLGQKYPSLQTMNGYSEILRNAFKLNDDIAATRTLTNGNINEYNNAIHSFPGMLVALVFGYRDEKLIDEDNIEANKTLNKADVDFSKF